MAEFSVYFAPSICVECVWMWDQHIRAQRWGSEHRGAPRDGHYFRGLPKNIIIKAMEEVWGSRAWRGNNRLELQWNTAAQSHCSSLKFDFPCDMIEIIIPGLGDMRGVFFGGG